MQKAVQRATKEVEAYRRDKTIGKNKPLHILRYYVICKPPGSELGYQGGLSPEGEPIFGHLTTDAAFWEPLQKLHAVSDKPAQFRLQVGSRSDPSGLQLAYVVSAIPVAASALAGVSEYALMFVCGFDEATQTYVLMHSPNEGDGAVLQEQQRRLGNSTPDGPPETPEERVYEVPAARLARYPGSMFRQYVKGQEVLARWKASAEILEPMPPFSTRPRKRWRVESWTTLFYPAEIVGGALVIL